MCDMLKPTGVGKWDVEAWLQNHASKIIAICSIILVLLVMALIAAIANMCFGLTGTESNIYYNQIDRII